MSNKETKDTIVSSLEEYQIFNSFVKDTQEIGHNFSFKSNPNIIFAESSKLDEKKEKLDFFNKYKELQSSNIAQPFYLEKELARHVKYWHSTNQQFKLPVLTMDNFFNEENVKSHLLKDTYIKKNPSIVTYYLIDYLISILEEKAFDKILMEGITTYQNEQYQIGLVGPIIDRDLIYYLINEDIEEKLNYLYKENSLGYSYIAEKIISFDLFIIYLILKNYPFYILRRERLEEIFNKVKKFKSFPYPIGSIGMDLFNLLIKELYLPGVTLFQEIRETFLLDIIDPKILKINCDYFIKVIAFSLNNTIYGMSCEKNNKNIINENINIMQENNKEIYKNNNRAKPGSKNDVIKLNELKDFTFTSLGVYSAFILFSSDEQKEEKETSYLVDILALFEKRYKAKRDNETSKDNISEKNIINNLFNLIDNGLDSNFASFSHDVKVINDKLITKTKEIHENTQNSPKDNINLRRFLHNKITFLNSKLLEKNIKRFVPQKFNHEENKNKLLINRKLKKKSKINENKNKENNIINIDNEENEFSEEDEKAEELKQKKECCALIKKYKKILEDEKKVSSDGVLDDYVKNFIKLKEKYFFNLQQFEIKNMDFESEELMMDIKKYNFSSKVKEKELSELYNQKYLITEDQFIDFIKSLFNWKSNINPLYHKKLYEEFVKAETLKNKDKKNSKSYLIKDFDIFEDDFPENEKDLSSIPLKTITKQKDEMEKIVQSKLYFNNRIYLLPGRINKNISRHISRNDYIYKSTIGDLFMNFFEQPPSKDSEEVIKTPLQIYLREAKHFFNLTVFKAMIKSEEPKDNYLKLNLYGHYYLLYGGVHIEATNNVMMNLDDSKTINFTNESLYIDIINIYNFENNEENKENQSKKINDIEKYLVYPNNDRFQIFVTAVKDSPNCNIENENQYFQKYISNLINFDAKSAYYESKKVIISSDNFTLTPTFLENITIKQCSYFEISFDNNNKESNEEEEEKEDENIDLTNEDEIKKIFETDESTSFNIKISTFLDFESNDN